MCVCATTTIKERRPSAEAKLASVGVGAHDAHVLKPTTELVEKEAENPAIVPTGTTMCVVP